MKLGIDIGSTTVKLIAIDENEKIVYKRYERHMSDVFRTTGEMLKEFAEKYPGECRVAITGSGGISLAEYISIPFQQEVISCSEAVERLIPQTDVVIELGGEDAKITFYGESTDQRMNGTCAGGTGAFIDQMALLLNTDAAGLNTLAENYSVIYPIAARCGVFAKTDLQPLINEGAAKEDLAASVFQAVVNQTITEIACGREICGNVAFLGGPLSFLPELRKRFAETLGLSDEQVIFPEDSVYYPAIGAAYLAESGEPVKPLSLWEKMKGRPAGTQAKSLEPLFRTEQDYEEFKTRHRADSVPAKDISAADGAVFLGIDAGSTTTKAVLIDEEGYMLYSYYGNNRGNTLESAKEILSDIYDELPDGAYIGYAVTTGYGEELVKKALRADGGEIETVAHFNGARAFLPNVDFILDIGGQDMKCIRIKNNAVDSIMLNEACSSGCGSFLETYARSVNLSINEFADCAVRAEHPVDLGSRCTVFMNSRVKQAQKEGASVGDIAAGLSYSVIKNALYKVMKLRDTDKIGKAVIVQGGTFLNDAVLRSLELILGREVVRPDIAGLMGAYGAALIAKSKWEKLVHEDGAQQKYRSSILGREALSQLTMETTQSRCRGCSNGCRLTIHTFSGGGSFVMGNRCEKGESTKTREIKTPGDESQRRKGSEAGHEHENVGELNLFRYKYHRLFDYEPIAESAAYRGRVGMPRVLNMYENYPFWFTFFTKLGFRMMLSPKSDKTVYESGMNSISSDTLCYPAKLAHGHMRRLVEQGEKFIFYPCINYELQENSDAQNHYNCPVVAMYPEVIAGNMTDLLRENGVTFMHPFLPYFDDKRLAKRMCEELSNFDVTEKEVRSAIMAARAEDAAFKNDVMRKGEEIIGYIEETGGHGIVLSGRPYHLDPEINHGIDKMIASYGFAVLTESSVAHMGKIEEPLRVLDQWTYHDRLYRAAEFCGGRDDMEFVQLNSFGCGIDAITTDEVEEILASHNKLYTVLKIDEVTNLGAAKIRIRSLKAAIKQRDENHVRHGERTGYWQRPIYTKAMKSEYTLILPQMAPMQFDLIEKAFLQAGYNAVMLPDVDKQDVELGVKYINNDACYPTIVTCGQIISALVSGKYDPDKTAVVLPQTGGACRASNYISLLRKALRELGMEQIPVVSFNGSRKLEQNPGMRFTLPFIKGLMYALLYGDLFMRLTNRVRPYEAVKGSTMALYRKWNVVAKENIEDLSLKTFCRNVKDIVSEFDELLVVEKTVKPRVGIVGEILVKYHPNANNKLVDIIEKEGGEAVVTDMFDYMMYILKIGEFNYEKMAGTYAGYRLNRMAMKLAYHYHRAVETALSASKRFSAPLHIDEIAERTKEVASLGMQSGEGWMLVGEMKELIESGVENIACLQPFGCLPNHVVGKGMIAPIKRLHPNANIVALDYDPGASEVNQLNRIKLMMASAHRKLA